jgi:hypothetical protein
MKLYATVTSERASKGQGGKKLDIYIHDETKRIGQIKVLPLADGSGNIISATIGTFYTGPIVVPVDTKGNKQKGECTVAGCDKNHKPTCTHGVPWHDICEPCIPF